MLRPQYTFIISLFVILVGWLELFIVPFVSYIYIPRRPSLRIIIFCLLNEIYCKMRFSPQSGLYSFTFYHFQGVRFITLIPFGVTSMFIFFLWIFNLLMFVNTYVLESLLGQCWVWEVLCSLYMLEQSMSLLLGLFLIVKSRMLYPLITEVIHLFVVCWLIEQKYKGIVVITMPNYLCSLWSGHLST
jgi:hypothetical protein